MAEFTVEFSQEAKKFLTKQDKSIANMILSWIKKNLMGTDDPRRTGKALHGEYKGSWRYRVGDYRLIAHIDDTKVTILILTIGHRSIVYK